MGLTRHGAVRMRFGEEKMAFENTIHIPWAPDVRAVAQSRGHAGFVEAPGALATRSSADPRRPLRSRSPTSTWTP
jgi:hypothetical protein